MSSKALRAHVHCLETQKVRTVYGRTRGYSSKPGGRAPANTRELHEQILALYAKGYTRKQIAAELGVCAATIGKHLTGRIRAMSK